MLAFVAGTATCTVFVILAIAGGSHLARPGTLLEALRGQDVLPVWLRVPVARGVVAVEVLLGGAGLVAFALGHRTALALALAGANLLFLAYAGYAGFVLSRRPGVPCGCSGGDVPMNGWIVARAGALAGLALVGLLGSNWTFLVRNDLAQLAIVGLAAATFGCLLWQLPAAMLDPEQRRGVPA